VPKQLLNEGQLTGVADDEDDCESDKKKKSGLGERQLKPFRDGFASDPFYEKKRHLAAIQQRQWQCVEDGQVDRDQGHEQHQTTSALTTQLGTHLHNFDRTAHLSCCGFEVGNQPGIATCGLSHQADELASGVLDQFS
jgi:hypothetical protein